MAPPLSGGGPKLCAPSTEWGDLWPPGGGSKSQAVTAVNACKTALNELCRAVLPQFAEHDFLLFLSTTQSALHAKHFPMPSK